MDLRAVFELEHHGPDTYVGIGMSYPWGGLYGGHIVAQALRAAAATVPEEFRTHSLRAYFIRRGDPGEPVRYEVDRIRNGRSFVTRRVVARQAVGAILNLESSFHVVEEAPDIAPVGYPAGIPGPQECRGESWSSIFRRHWVAADRATVPRTGGGRVLAWMRVTEDLGDDPLLHACALAYLSDDLPTDAVIEADPRFRRGPEGDGERYTASLDHTIWFHRPGRADRWHLHDFSCHSAGAGRGLAIGHLFGVDGVHLATVAQEVLVRDARDRR